MVVLPHDPWERAPYAPIAPAGAAREAEPQATALLALPATTRLDAVRGQVHHHVAVILGHRDATAIDETTSLFDDGLDSLMPVDLAREPSATFAIELTFAQISSSLHQLRVPTQYRSPRVAMRFAEPWKSRDCGRAT